MAAMENLLGPISINHYLFLSSILFSIGVMGVLLRRNFIVIFMSIELMLNSVNVLLAAFSRFNGNQDGQVFVFFIMTVAAAESAIGLAILVLLFRNMNSINVDELDSLKG
jgi:NADH-quinone oxidoreductase subunit K